MVKHITGIGNKEIISIVFFEDEIVLFPAIDVVLQANKEISQSLNTLILLNNHSITLPYRFYLNSSCSRIASTFLGVF
jgi:hypothetical protein